MKLLGTSAVSNLNQSIDSLNKSKFAQPRRNPTSGLSLAEIQSIVTDAVQSAVDELKKPAVKKPIATTSTPKRPTTPTISKVDVYEAVKRHYSDYHRNPFGADFDRLLSWCGSMSVNIFCIPEFPALFTRGLGIGNNGAFVCSSETHSEIWIDLSQMRSLDAQLHMDSEVVVKFAIAHELGHVFAARMGARLDSHDLDEKLAWAYAQTIVENNYSVFGVAVADFQRFSSHFVKG